MLVGVTNYLIIYIQFNGLSPRDNFQLGMAPPTHPRPVPIPMPMPHPIIISNGSDY